MSMLIQNYNCNFELHIRFIHYVNWSIFIGQTFFYNDFPKRGSPDGSHYRLRSRIVMITYFRDISSYAVDIYIYCRIYVSYNICCRDNIDFGKVTEIIAHVMASTATPKLFYYIILNLWCCDDHNN